MVHCITISTKVDFMDMCKEIFPVCIKNSAVKKGKKNMNNLRRKMPSEVYINLVESKHSYNVNTYNQFL